MQPRDTCYIADQGLPALQYSGYQPHAHPWDDYPPLKEILGAVRPHDLSTSLMKRLPPTPSVRLISPSSSLCAQVHEALPGSSFNSLLLNRYKGGSDYVAWHADDEKLYGHDPEIASVSLGCERDFLLRKKKMKKPPITAPHGKYLGRKRSFPAGHLQF